MATYNYKPGLGLAASYQVSGKPFVSGSINAAGSATSLGPHGVNFPNVTSWVTVVNNDSNNECRVGFSEFGVVGSNYFVVPALTNNTAVMGPLDVKVTQIWLSGSTDVSVIAGLTYIGIDQINNSAVSPSGSTNWSGSTGATVG